MKVGFTTCIPSTTTQGFFHTSKYNSEMSHEKTMGRGKSALSSERFGEGGCGSKKNTDYIYMWGQRRPLINGYSVGHVVCGMFSIIFGALIWALSPHNHYAKCGTAIWTGLCFIPVGIFGIFHVGIDCPKKILLCFTINFLAGLLSLAQAGLSIATLSTASNYDTYEWQNSRPLEYTEIQQEKYIVIAMSSVTLILALAELVITERCSRSCYKLIDSASTAAVAQKLSLLALRYDSEKGTILTLSHLEDQTSQPFQANCPEKSGVFTINLNGSADLTMQETPPPYASLFDNNPSNDQDINQ